MTIVPVSFGLQSNPGEWGHDGANRLINAYAEDMGNEGKVRFPLRASPGFKLFGQAPVVGQIRGLIPVGGTLFTVSGQALYPVDTTGMFGESIGGIPGTEQVSMVANRKIPNPQVAIVVSGNRYILDTDPAGPSLAVLTDPDLPPPIDVDFVDGYFIFTIADGRVFNSTIEEGTNIETLAFFTGEGHPDKNVGIGVRSREIFLFGEKTTEVWANDGTDNASPFSRSLGEFIQVGCVARRSIANFMESLAWVDDEGIVRLASGYSARRISHHAVERAIEDLADPSEITALTYKVAGHKFLQLSSSQWTWEYNGTTTLWNERQSYQQPRHRGSVSTVFNGKRIVGDVANGKLYEVDRKTFDEAGDPLIWTIRAPTLHSFPNALRVSRFYAQMIPGVGINETDPALKDPKAMLRYSDDGAHSWSNTRELRLGKIGEREKTSRTNNLGRCGPGGRVWELSVSAAVARGLISAAADIGQRAT